MTIDSKFLHPGICHTVFDEGGKCTELFFDKSFLTVLGLDTEQFFENPENVLKEYVHPDDKESLNAHWAECRKKHPEGMDFDIEFRMMTKRGYRWFHDHAVCTRREDGSLARCDGMVIDIQDTVDSKRLREDLIQQMMGGESVYIVNPETDVFTVLHRNRYLTEAYGDDEIYSESIAKYIGSDVYPADRSRMTAALEPSNLVRQVNAAEEYVQEYQDISSGIPTWYRMRARRLSDNEILLGFANKDKEIANNLILQTIEADYVAMLGINLDERRVKVLKIPDSVPQIEEGESFPYHDFMTKLATVLQGEAGQQFEKMADVEYMKKILATENKLLFRYKSPRFGLPHWSTFSIYVVRRHYDGSPFLCSLGFYRLDADSNEKEELQLKVKKAMDMIGGLASSYTALYHVNLDTGAYQNYYLTKFADNIKPYFAKCPKFSDLAHGFADSPLVHPDDRENLHKFYESEESVRTALKGKKSLATLFQRNYGGRFLWTEITIVKCEPIDETAHTVIVGFTEKDYEVREKELHVREAEEEKLLIESIVSKYNLVYSVNMADDSYTVLRLDENVAGQEIKFENFSQIRNFFKENIIHPRDRHLVENELEFSTIRKRLSREKSYTLEYRTLIGEATVWNEMKVASFTEDKVIIAFSFNDFEICRRRMDALWNDEYLALFSVDIDTKMIKALKTTPLFNTAPVGVPVAYEYAMNVFASAFSDDAREVFKQRSTIDFVKKDFAKENKRTYAFKTSERAGGKWIEYIAYVIKRHDDGTPAMFTMGFMKMDTFGADRQEMQKQLKIATEQAQSANRSKTNFLFNMSHDIRTPMNAITGFTTMAKKNVGDSAKVTDYLNKIDIAGQQLLILVNQVLEMSRIESGKVELHETPVNIKEKNRALVAILSEQANVAGLEFFHSLGKIQHPDVFADEVRMSQITLNITGNAIKYTPEGGRIDFSLREIPCDREGYARFVFIVADTGIGMSEEFQKRLFEPFAREKSSTVSKVQGTGLGMTIVKSLVDLMGGKIEFESELGKGTKFVISIDLRIDEEAVVTKAGTAVTADSMDFSGRRVLLVEDNELNREIAKFLLEDRGMVIDEAEDGDVAVEKVQLVADNGDYSHYDFILMDIQMPRMNGYEASRRIRAIPMPDGVHIPIIAMTANAFDEDKRNAIAAGMDDHIAKPIDAENLWNTLAKYL